jgi:hypothetical protein
VVYHYANIVKGFVTLFPFLSQYFKMKEENKNKKMKKVAEYIILSMKIISDIFIIVTIIVGWSCILIYLQDKEFENMKFLYTVFKFGLPVYLIYNYSAIAIKLIRSCIGEKQDGN